MSQSMMNPPKIGSFKLVRVKDEEVITDAATSWEVDLPKALISTIGIRIAGLGGAGTPAMAYTLVTNVRIDTDGKDSKPLELSATQIVRRQGIMQGIPYACTSGAAGAYCQIPFQIYFGTKAKDRRLMLDLRNCNKRKMTFTFSAALVGANLFAAGNAKLTILAVTWEGIDPPEHMGHIRQEQVLSQATGTGDFGAWYDMPIHPRGKLAFIDFTVSDTTTVANIELTAKSDTISLINEHFRDIVNRMNYGRHLDTALTLTAYKDFMYIDRFESDPNECPVNDQLGNQMKLTFERGATTTTIVIILGTIMAK